MFGYNLWVSSHPSPKPTRRWKFSYSKWVSVSVSVYVCVSLSKFVRLCVCKCVCKCICKCVCALYPFHPIKCISKTDILFPCWTIVCREEYVKSYERVQDRFLRKWLWTGLEKSLQCFLSFFLGFDPTNTEARRADGGHCRRRCFFWSVVTMSRVVQSVRVTVFF